MEKGILNVNKTKKGKIKVSITKSNGKNLILSFVTFKDTSLNGKECEYSFKNNRLEKIKVDDKIVFGFEEKKRENTKSKNNNTSYQINDSFNIQKAQVPEDTKNIASIYCDNFNLKFNKFARFEENNTDFSKSKFKFFKTEKGKIVYQIQPNFGDLNFDNICTNQQDKAKALCPKTEIKNLSIDWRLTIGLGNESVYETSITLHHIYGIPYIPASAIKGVVHHWAIDQLKEKAENKENPEILSRKQKEIKDIFGAEWDFKNPVNPVILSENNEQGKIIFFDAFPCSEPTIEPDIMNNHYNDYYGGDKPPTDFQNPNPVLFLTVKDTSFQFIIGVRNTENEDLLTTAKDWLKNALTQKGIGAKTAVGYGYMSEKKS